MFAFEANVSHECNEQNSTQVCKNTRTGLGQGGIIYCSTMPLKWLLPGESSSNRKNIQHTLQTLPRSSLSAAEISQAVCVWLWSPWNHVCILHPWHPLAMSSRDYLYTDIMGNVFEHNRHLVCWWKGRMICVVYDSTVSLLWSLNGGFSCSVNNLSLLGNLSKTAE